MQQCYPLIYNFTFFLGICVFLNTFFVYLELKKKHYHLLQIRKTRIFGGEKKLSAFCGEGPHGLITL